MFSKILKEYTDTKFTRKNQEYRERTDDHMKKQIIIIASVTVAIALLIVGYLVFFKKKPADTDENIDTTVFTPPEGFDWEGSYIDSIGETAVLTIEKAGDKYLCSVSIPSSDVSYINTYVFEAVNSKDSIGLSYENCTHTEYLIPDADSDLGVTTNELYTDGTGVLYYYKDRVFWLDDKDSAGEGLAFLKQE